MSIGVSARWNIYPRSSKGRIERLNLGGAAENRQVISFQEIIYDLIGNSFGTGHPWKGRDHAVRRGHTATVSSAMMWCRGQQNMTRLRIDKWLWAARFFKTRSLAGHACELGRIEANNQPAKPSREVKAGDMLQIKNDSGEFRVEVLALSEVRGPADIAQTLYHETDASREQRLKLQEERKIMVHFEALREGKPSKRDRRELDRLKGRL
jgi:ribosome-associated heat shock protein Hsp15